MNVTLAMSPISSPTRAATRPSTAPRSTPSSGPAYLDGLRERRQEAAARKRDADELVALLEDGGHASPPGCKFSRDEINACDTGKRLEIHAFYQLSIWNSLVIAAAEAAKCDRILSEDLNDGQRYCGILARNPF